MTALRRFPQCTLRSPVRSDHLYGRTEDLAAVSDLLQRHALVSIVGAGGIGKTRVAQALAVAQREHFAGGIWWVELSQLSDGAAVTYCNRPSARHPRR